ncbi:MAG: bifunctional demethylmenaquinone methyltransferase/2-methoxy-6-polyprenyl-1,4-benzoquinol methylase UbiE [candidate division Zixibacteria bacterium]|nr:bifunctional demethylmenaquinone methyltransferase/2-methoxy-6-polyprenyl-1,4-benzoquinol methylase UbiE [candidate division Zixibacteria bacterium]
MFDRIARRYDFLNHMLSANRDVKWRRQLADLLPDGENLRVLDLATGTGDQLLSLYDCQRVADGVGIDMADRMLDIGRKKISDRGLSDKLQLRTGDAQQIEENDHAFDAVTISFGIRNMSDVREALAEMFRVLKPGGRALILEFSLPSNTLMRRLYLLYLRHILPRLGRAISGEDGAYRYLNQTIESFPYGDEFCRLMRETGFTNVADNKLTLGVASIYQGDRP